MPLLRLRRQLFYYLVVGGLTVVVDIGLLALLHESYGVPLGAATTVAFCTAVVVNFLLNRTAMSSGGSVLDDGTHCGTARWLWPIM